MSTPQEALVHSNGHLTAEPDVLLTPHHIPNNKCSQIWAAFETVKALHQIVAIQQEIYGLAHRRIVRQWEENREMRDQNGVATFVQTRHGLTDLGLYGYRRYIENPNSAINLYAKGVDGIEQK